MTVAPPTADEHAPHFATYISKVTGPVDPVPALQAQRDAVFARLARPVDWDAIDDRPVAADRAIVQFRRQLKALLDGK